MTLPAFAAERHAATLLLGARYCRLMSPAHTALSSKPAARHYCCQTMVQMEGRTLYHFIDPSPLHTLQAVSLKQAICHRWYLTEPLIYM